MLSVNYDMNFDTLAHFYHSEIIPYDISATWLVIMQMSGFTSDYSGYSMVYQISTFLFMGSIWWDVNIPNIFD